MKLTVTYLENKFKEFNKRFFNNELPNIPIKVRASKRNFGYYRYKLNKVTKKEEPICISISNYFDQTGKAYCETLIHEMIHYYLSIKNIREKDIHGYFFRKEMDRINNFQNQYTISVCGSSKGLKFANKNKQIVLLQFTYKGEEYISRISQSGLVNTKVLDKFDRIPGVKCNKIYKTKNIKLDKMPTCKTRLRLTKFTKEFEKKYELEVA